MSDGGASSAGPAAPPATAVGDHTNADLSAPELRRLFFRVFPSVAMPMFLAAIDQTIVATALPAIAGTLGDIERVSWVVVSYLIASTIAAPVYGRLGDVFGRKRLMFFALFLFLAASAACAIAPGMLSLTAARVFQGFGGGGLMTLSQALIGEAVPPRQRGRFQGYLAAIFMCSATIGPVAGGWLTQHVGWRSVFLVNLPLGLIAAFLLQRLAARPAARVKFRFDVLGLVLFTLFVVPLLLALERAQQFDLGSLPIVAGLVAVALASLTLLLRQERRSSEPLIPVRLLGLPAIWRADTIAACIGGALISNVTFMPIYLQVVRGASPDTVGLVLLPLTGGVALGSLFTGQGMLRTGRTAIFPSIGLVFTTALLVSLALFAPRLTLTELPIVLGLMSFSIGTAMPVVNVTVQTVAGLKNLGAAAASIQFSRSIGAALGTATVGAVLFAVLAAHDPHTATLFAQIVQQGPRVLDTIDPVRRAVATSEIADAFRLAFLTVAALSGVAMVLAWSLPVRRL